MRIISSLGLSLHFCGLEMDQFVKSGKQNAETSDYLCLTGSLQCKSPCNRATGIREMSSLPLLLARAYSYCIEGIPTWWKKHPLKNYTEKFYAKVISWEGTKNWVVKGNITLKCNVKHYIFVMFRTVIVSPHWLPKIEISSFSWLVFWRVLQPKVCYHVFSVIIKPPRYKLVWLFAHLQWGRIFPTLYLEDWSFSPVLERRGLQEESETTWIKCS